MEVDGGFVLRGILEIALTEAQMDALAERMVAKNRGDQEPNSYTVEEAAEKLRISVKTVRRRVEAGRIARIPGIGRVRIPRAEMQRLLNEPQIGGRP